MPEIITDSFGGNFFTRHLTKQVADVLPRRVKRFFYVGSAMGMLLRDKSPDTAIVERVNNNLKLAYGVSAVLLPIYMGAIIWRDLMTNLIELQVGYVPISEIDACSLSESDCWRVAAYLARRPPTCLQYGSDQLMAADIHDMLVSLKKAA